MNIFVNDENSQFYRFPVFFLDFMKKRGSNEKEFSIGNVRSFSLFFFENLLEAQKEGSNRPPSFDSLFKMHFILSYLNTI